MCGCSVACRCKVDDRCVQTEHLTLYDTLYYDSKHKADNAPTESEGPNKEQSAQMKLAQPASMRLRAHNVGRVKACGNHADASVREARF